MEKVHEVGWCIASALKATQRASKSSWFLACSPFFLVCPFAELVDEGCSFSDLVCMLCRALRGGSVRKNPKHTVAWDRGRRKQILPAESCCWHTLLSTEACKTSCHDAKENLRTEPCCWCRLHHAEYSNESWAKTKTANLFFVVFYSYQRESPSRDSLKSCDGKSVAQDIGIVSKLADHIGVAECSGNTHDWVLCREFQGKCVGQISIWPVVSSRNQGRGIPGSDMPVVHVSEVPRILDVLMLERHTVSLHLRRGALFQQFQIIAKARVRKDQAAESFS